MRMKTKDTGGKKENTSDGRRAQPGEWPGELEGGPGGRCSLGRYKSNRLGHTAQLTSRWLHVSFGQGPEKICLFTFPTIFLPARHTEIFVCFFFLQKFQHFHKSRDWCSDPQCDICPPKNSWFIDRWTFYFWLDAISCSGEWQLIDSKKLPKIIEHFSGFRVEIRSAPTLSDITYKV